MDRNAAEFVKSAASMTTGQKDKLARDIDVRLGNSDTLAAIAREGSEPRVLNFKAMNLELGDERAQIVEQALSRLKAAKAHSKQLAENASGTEETQQANAIYSSVDNYLQAVSSYHQLRLSGSEGNDELSKLLSAMDASAGSFTQKVDSAIVAQKQLIEVALSERVQKIDMMNQIMNLGNQARINNFKGQAKDALEDLKQAITNIDEMAAFFSKLDKITRDAEDIELVDITRNSALNYQSSTEQYLGLFKELKRVSEQTEAKGETALKRVQSISKTEDASRQTEATMRASAEMMSIGLGIALIVGIGLALAIKRSINKSLAQAKT